MSSKLVVQVEPERLELHLRGVSALAAGTVYSPVVLEGARWAVAPALRLFRDETCMDAVAWTSEPASPVPHHSRLMSFPSLRLDTEATLGWFSDVRDAKSLPSSARVWGWLVAVDMGNGSDVGPVVLGASRVPVLLHDFSPVETDPGESWSAVLAEQLFKKMDKLPAPCPANFFPVTKADGTLQRSSYSPGSFAQSWHEHYSYNIMHYTDPAMGAYNSLDYVLDDILARVSSLEASGGGALEDNIGVTLGTVHHDGMSAVAHPGKVGAGDYSDWPSPSDCMTCLMVRADRVLDPTVCGDFAMGGDLRSDYYGVVAGVEYEDSSCITARFALPLYDGATCYGNVQPTWDRMDFDYWREGTPSSGCIGRLVQDAEGTWWLCCTPRIKCFCESPMPTTYGDDDPYAIATAIKSTYSSSCFDFDAQMRAFLKYADCGCDVGDVVADGYTTVTISGSPAI